MALLPPMVWHNIQKKVLVRCELPNLKDVEVTIADQEFTFKASQGDKKYEIKVPLANEIIAEESRWFGNDRAVSLILTKKDDGIYWEKISSDAALKRVVKPDLVNWIDEDEPGYTGSFEEPDEPGMGGMGGMPPPGVMEALMKDPELMQAMQNPKVMAALQEMQSNPANAAKYMGDPEIMSLVMKLQGLMGGGM
mmetsp:Transcript_2604/g.7451  ORF Transcript_2604/g.7451 Transcript_2604/m.7451 type:complete len:194 (-) Transcript_2604:439-1020(-)